MALTFCVPHLYRKLQFPPHMLSRLQFTNAVWCKKWVIDISMYVYSTTAGWRVRSPWGRVSEGRAKTCTRTVKFTGELQSAQVSTPSQLSHNEMLKLSPWDFTQPFSSYTEMDILIDMHRPMHGDKNEISLCCYERCQCCKMEVLLVLVHLLMGWNWCLLMVTELYADKSTVDVVLHVSSQY